MSRIFKGERGQAMVELAFVLPILAFLLIGLMTTALFINSKLVVMAAARDGARAAAITYGQTDWVETVRNRVEAAIDGGGLKTMDGSKRLFNPDDPFFVSITTESVGGESFAVVSVQYYQPSIVPLLPRLLNSGSNALPDHFLLRGRAQFRIEPRPDASF